MSLRLRLTLTYGVLLTLTLISFGLVLYVMMRQNIEDEADRRLRIRSQQVSATLWPANIHLQVTTLHPPALISRL